MEARKYLDKWLSGNTLNLQSNCNSKYRELQRAKERNDIESVNFWTRRIELIKQVQDILFTLFYKKEDEIKNENDFNQFKKIFERFTERKTGMTMYEIYTGGPKL